MSANQEDFINLSNLMDVLSKCKDKNFLPADEKPQPKCQGSRVQEPRPNAKAASESRNLDKIPRQNPGMSRKCQGRVREPRANSKADFNKKVRTGVDPKDKLREQIARVEMANFELRDSNVKLQRLSKAQDAKMRDLRYRISLQEQKYQKDEADKKTIGELEGTLEQKLSQIKNLKSKIELIRGQLADDDCPRKVPNVTPARISRSAESYRKPSGGVKRRSIDSLESFYQKVSAIPGHDIGSIEEEYSKKTVKKVFNTGSRAKFRAKVCEGKKTGTDIQSTVEKLRTIPSGGSTMGSVLSKLNSLLEELNGFCIADSANCKEFLEEAHSRIESLMARVNGETVDVNGKQQNLTDSNNFAEGF